MKFRWRWHWKKTIGYRIGAILITLGACLFWTHSAFESIEITITIAVVKTIFYEVYENIHDNYFKEK